MHSKSQSPSALSDSESESGTGGTGQPHCAVRKNTAAFMEASASYLLAGGHARDARSEYRNLA